MPSNNPTPIERIGLTDEERFEAYVKGAAVTALREAVKAGWISLDVEKGPTRQYHDLHDTARHIVWRLKREGVRLTPAQEDESLL